MESNSGTRTKRVKNIMGESYRPNKMGGPVENVLGKGSRSVIKKARYNNPDGNVALYDTSISEVPVIGELAQVIVITPPRFQHASINIVGAEGSAYVQHNFSEKARKVMEERMASGVRGKNTSRNKAPRDFNAEYLAAAHRMADGSYGIPAPAFRNAMITACGLVGYAMTKAKMTIFVIADGVDRENGMPLVRLYGDPQVKESQVRVQQTTTSVWRPMWETWNATVRLKWDADQFSAADVFNLMARAGAQVGVGEGRPASKNSAGLGWGLWDIVQ